MSQHNATEEAQEMYDQIKAYAKVSNNGADVDIFANPLFRELTTIYLETRLCSNRCSGILEGRAKELTRLERLRV